MLGDTMNLLLLIPDSAAINSGETYAQIFVGMQTLITDVYAMKSPAQFPGTLSDNITEHDVVH